MEVQFDYVNKMFKREQDKIMASNALKDIFSDVQMKYDTLTCDKFYRNYRNMSNVVN